MKKKSQKPYLTDYNVLIVWQCMASSFANLVNNLAERINKFKCKYEHDHVNVNFMKLDRNIATAFFT